MSELNYSVHIATKTHEVSATSIEEFTEKVESLLRDGYELTAIGAIVATHKTTLNP